MDAMWSHYIQLWKSDEIIILPDPGRAHLSFLLTIILISNSGLSIVSQADLSM